MYTKAPSNLAKTVIETGEIVIKTTKKFETAGIMDPNMTFVPYEAIYASEVFTVGDEKESAKLARFYVTEWQYLYECERFDIHNELALENKGVQELFLRLVIEKLIQRASDLGMKSLGIETTNRFVPELLVETGFSIEKEIGDNVTSYRGTRNV